MRLRRLKELPPRPSPIDGSDIAERVRLELLIRDEVKRLGDEKKKGFLEHPAVLLILGFLLTTGAGSVVTSWWQYEQWSREQHYRAAQQVTKQRSEVMTFTAQSVAQSFTAAEDVLHLSAWEWRKNSDVALLKERATNWTAESRKWRTAEKVLLARIAATYPDPRSSQLLEEILKARRFLGNDITNLLALEDQLKRSAADQKEIDETSQHALQLINGVTGKDGTLRLLIAHMVQQTQAGDQLPPPQSFWKWLLSSS